MNVFQKVKAAVLAPFYRYKQAAPPLYTLDYRQAQDNLGGANPYARWNSAKGIEPHHAGARIREAVVRPKVKNNHFISRNDVIFTIGSCFARAVENALDARGMQVSSVIDPVWAPGLRGYHNRYNTYAMLYELQAAAGEISLGSEGFAELGKNDFVDLHSHPMIQARNVEDVLKERGWLTDYFARAFKASMVIITLGLIECWFDKKTGRYLNFVPSLGGRDANLLLERERFEFHVSSFEENMKNLEEIYRILTMHNPDVKIVVTVSPVPLTATLTDRDVITANMLSKSMLRTCAETWKSRHPERIDYFPSFEMAVLSDAKLVWGPDALHVNQSFADEIMDHFLKAYVKA